MSITGGSFPGDGDILSVGGVTSNTVNGITFVWMPAQHALVFSGASSVANYQALLRQVQFQSSSDNPTDFNHSPQRTLTWAVTDSASVTTATTTINIGRRERRASGDGCRNRRVHRERLAGDDLAGRDRERRRQLRPDLWRG